VKALKWFAGRATGIRGRLLLILGMAGLAIIAASAAALVALLDTRSEVTEVMDRQLPAATAALVLARVGERLQDRTPALMAAQGAEARKEQTELVNRDLLSLAGETERLRRLTVSEDAGSGDIAMLAPRLADNLRQLACLLEERAGFDADLDRQRAALIALRERVQQILGPSILAVDQMIGEGESHGSGLFRRAARAQGPLLEAERLVGSALRELLIAAEASTVEDIRLSRQTFDREIHQLVTLLRQVPAGLRMGLQSAVDELALQSGEHGVFALHESALEAASQADRLVADSRQVAAALKGELDVLVGSTNEKIALAAEAMGDALFNNTLRFVAVSILVVLVATLLSYRVVVLDISDNLRAVTAAMQRLADGERDAQVPAMERRDEIGDLARVFNVFKENAFRMETLDRQLTEKSNLLLATFDNMNDGFTVFDEQRRLVAWNPRYLQLYGLSDSDIALGIPIERILAVLAKKGVRVYTSLAEEIPIQDLFSERWALTKDLEVRCPDGHRVELRRNPMPDSGFVTLHMDVSERRLMESQLRQAQKMEAVGQLTGGIAHDFNNILAAIVGNLTQLEMGVRDDPFLHERWQRAMGASDRAARQVERLLAFSRRQRLAPETVDVNELLGGMIDLLEYSLGENIALHTDLAPDLAAVRVDPGQLENALMNLAINARDAIEGKGQITFSTTRYGPDAVEIAVRDSGCGIASELLDRVFDPFFTTKAAGKGSGLGLSMVYGFVQQSGGSVAIDSAPGEGTTVRIRLPLADGHEQPVPASPDDDETQAEPRPGQGETILVVDDDRDLLEATADQLRSLGYRVLTAKDGGKALEALQQTPEIRLLYTDVVMPRPWDGQSLAREAVSRRPGLPILFTSAEAGELVDPAAVLLRKPVPIDLLARTVARLLDS